MLNEQNVPIDFGQGLDTKTDPKAVVPGKFIRLENGVFTNVKRIAKRNGYTAAGTTTAPLLVHGYGNELLNADQNNLYSYSSNQNSWQSKGSYVSVELARKQISGFSPPYASAPSGCVDVAILGNYALYGWVDVVGNTCGAVVDLSTDDILVISNSLATGAPTPGEVKCALLGGTTLALIYQKSTSQYFGRTVNFSGGNASFSAESTVLTVSAINPLDLIETATGAAIVYSRTNAVVVATLSTSLAVSAATIAVTTGASSVVAISKTSNGNIWIYWTETTDDSAGNLTALSIYSAIYSSTLVPVATRTKVLDTADPYYVSAMMAKPDSASQQTLYYGLFTPNNHGTDHEVEYSNYVTVSVSGATITPGVATLFANGVIPFSHHFTIGSRIYAVFYYRHSDITVAIDGFLGPPTQPTLFVLELTNLQAPPLVVARFGAGVASSYNGAYIHRVFTQNVASFSSSKFYFSCGLTVQAQAAPATFINGEIGNFSYSFDFSGLNTYVAKNSGDTAVLNGAVMQMYDGSNCVELGFHLFPEITNVTDSGGGGNIADGVYNYLAIFQWTDNNGNLHQSTPSPVVTVTTTGGSSTVTLTLITGFLTRKSTIVFGLYRTTGATGTPGSIYYLINSGTISVANPSTAITTINDSLADTTIITKNQAYTYPASSVLENTVPPPSMIMLSHNNRLFFVDSENPNTYWYTKSFQPGNGISPSGFLLQQIDPKLGNISSLADMDEKLVIFKSSGIFIQSGDGANDTGTGSSLSFPQVVPSDVGCTVLKSNVATPKGVMFKSANGIYLLDRSLNVSYIGSEVQNYNSQIITGATFVPGKSQIRFLCSTGLTLVYDYIFNQWSTFTAHTGVSSATWNNLYVYSTGTSVFQEAAGVYADNGSAFALLAQTSWLAFAGIQGFQRVKRLIMLGDFTNGNSASHNISVAAAYDFSTTFQNAITYAFGAISASGVFQYRERLPIQKCDSISLLIQETTTGSNLEYVDLTNMSFEVGIKKGLNKLSGTRSVG